MPGGVLRVAKRAVYPGALSLADLLGLGERFAVASICAVPRSAGRAAEQASAAAAFAGAAIAARRVMPTFPTISARPRFALSTPPLRCKSRAPPYDGGLRTFQTIGGGSSSDNGITLPHLIRCQHHTLYVDTKALPGHQSIDCFERITFRRQCRQPLARIAQPELPHPRLRESRHHA
jgi:hypothetical protein